MTTSYHRGEHAVQAKAGLTDMAGRLLGGIRAALPDVAATFLTRQPVLFLGASDHDGRMWATMLTGKPGFIQVPDRHTVTVAAQPSPGDPLAQALAGTTRIGMIAIEPATRRRMRVNGTGHPTPDGLVIDVDEVISNCPRYIQQRTPEPSEVDRSTGGARWGDGLTPAQQERIRTADTFFVTTASDDGRTDTSHRGGNPGFVHVPSPTQLSWPDYVGNAMFLTLGNLELQPAAGLLFPDWQSGNLLHVSGTARTDWDPARTARFPGAQRVIDMTITDVVEVTGASPLRWSAPSYSRFNPVPG